MSETEGPARLMVPPPLTPAPRPESIQVYESLPSQEVIEAQYAAYRKVVEEREREFFRGGGFDANGSPSDAD